MKKNRCFITKLVTLVAVIASICGVLFIFKDSIANTISKLKEKFTTKDDFDDFDDDFDDFDDEIVEDKSDREYVSINIGDEKDETSDEESEDEISEEETTENTSEE
ncbi:MAG: DNA-directed RNA polymerase subunit delta [Lachnospiraceae bacterium]|nr:DNA-directed RNA polymerase subunit delta [Lachnospiraceae bacterium]